MSIYSNFKNKSVTKSYFEFYSVGTSYTNTAVVHEVVHIETQEIKQY